MTNERASTESPEERAARVQAAKERAAAARAARESGAAPAADATSAATSGPPPAALPPTATAAPPPDDDRPRTASGTLKRDPNEAKKEVPATPEEKAARVAAAKAAAAAAKAAREAGGGVTVTRGAAPAGAVEAHAEAAAEIAAGPGDGLERTAKGTIKRDPNAPKKEAPATPEEKAARIAAAKAAARAAKERAAAAPAEKSPAMGSAPASGITRQVTGTPGVDEAAFRKAYEAVTKPLPGVEPLLRPVAAVKAERPAPPNEYPMSDAAEATVAAFREAMPEIRFEVQSSPIDPILVIDRADVLRVMRAARDHPLLDMKLLRSMTCVDQMDEGIDAVYHLKSLTTGHAAEVKTRLPANRLEVDSITVLWRGANWLEREAMEMFGIVCLGHPDPRPLLLDDDMNIHPLLKMHPLAEIELKQGVNVF